MSPFRNIPGEEAMLIRGGEESGNLPGTLDLAARSLKPDKDTHWRARGVGISACAHVHAAVAAVRSFPSCSAATHPHQRPESMVRRSESLVPGFLVRQFSSRRHLPFGANHPFGACRGNIGKMDRLPASSVRPNSALVLLPAGQRLCLAFTLATLLQANVQIAHALDAMLEMPGTSPWLKERIRGVKVRLQLGKNFGQALDEAGHDFPDREIIDDLLVYSKLPGFERRLHLIAEEWLQSGLERAKLRPKSSTQSASASSLPCSPAWEWLSRPFSNFWDTESECNSQGESTCVLDTKKDRTSART